MTLNEFFKRYGLPIIGALAIGIMNIFLFGKLDKIDSELLLIKGELGEVKASVFNLTSASGLNSGWVMEHEGLIGELKSARNGLEKRLDRLEGKVFQ